MAIEVEEIQAAPPKPVRLLPKMHESVPVGITFAWKGHTNLPVAADVAGAALDAIARENDGAVMPATVVARSKRRDAPLHEVFEWDDTAAAEQYRLSQAYYLIRSLVVKVQAFPDKEPIETRAYVAVHPGTGQEDVPATRRVYVKVDVAMQQREMREQVLTQALKDLASWRHKYEVLEELADVFVIVDRALAGRGKT